MMAKTKTKRAVKIPSPKSQREAGDSNSDAETSTAPDLSRLLALGTKAISLSDLDFLPDNPMEHSEESIEDMRDRLRARGQLLPLVVNARSGRPVVVGGNRRLQAMLAEGWTHAAVVEVNMADDQAMALALELNALQDQSWHKDLLAKAMKRLDGINLGERMDVVMSRLAEAQKLIPGLGGGFNGSAEPDEEDAGDEPEDALDLLFKVPFPWFGGKSRVARMVWKRFGPVTNFIEPFFGSGACLLNRPPPFEGTETVNDFDGLVCNFWRAVQGDPEGVANFADWPVNESDLHARHLWLVERKETLQAKLEGDPDYYDAKTAGWWCWGMACWIGSGFCSGDGPWGVEVAEDGSRKLVHLGNAGRGVNRKRVHLGNAGQGGPRRMRSA